MNKEKIFGFIKKTLFIQAVFLLVMSLSRLVFFLYFKNQIDEIDYIELFDAFVLGLRIDLMILAYGQLLITLSTIIFYYIKPLSSRYENQFITIVKTYIMVIFLYITTFTISDFAFYSYFGEHISVLFFGLFEDDTVALIYTIWNNYHVVLISTLIAIYIYALYIFIKKVFSIECKNNSSVFGIKNIHIVFFALFLLNVMAGRGSFGIFPLGEFVPDVSKNKFVNTLPQNGVNAFAKAIAIRKNFNTNYNLINNAGFKGNIQQAFKILNGNKDINTKDLLSNLYHTTSLKNYDKDYNVVVIMAESFGMPITKYQSDKFDILGEIKQHFKEDYLFKNFISSGNGTIDSLEAMLLNIPNLPGSFAFSQSPYKKVSFKYAPPFVFKNNGYKTTFVYGGDATWRNVGLFFSNQGFDKVITKQGIYSDIDSSDSNKEYLHTWGIYDEFLYEKLFIELNKTDDKKFIFALTTNNHPPYEVPKQYKGKSLIFSEDLKKHLTANGEIITKRLHSYAYSLDTIGKFITKFKKSKFAQNTILVVTADNHTLDGDLTYDNNKIFNSKHIPFYLYLPTALKNKFNSSIDVETFGSHKDIFPTIFNIALSNAKYLSIGENMLDKNAIHFGVNGSAIIAGKDKTIEIGDLKKTYKDFQSNYYRACVAAGYYLTRYYINEHENNLKAK